MESFYRTVSTKTQTVRTVFTGYKHDVCELPASCCSRLVI